MFTWNFQFISKARLREMFNQLMVDPKKGDILVRIHTAIHGEKEAVDLASENAVTGDVVLYSPGATDDEFEDFAKRGEEFKKIINK